MTALLKSATIVFLCALTTGGHSADPMKLIGVIEAVFARVRMVDGVGIVAVYSQREYGDKAAAVVGEWLQKNGPAVEKTLMSWDRVPSVAQLKALPRRNDHNAGAR